MSNEIHDQPEAPQPSVSPRRFLATPGGRLTVAVVVLVLGAWLLTPDRGAGHAEARRQSKCRNNLKQISTALFSYFDVYHCLLPPSVADAKGRPMHSWRVLILPYLDQDALYKEYRFDEPWDGPHNKLLAERGAELFHCPKDLPQDGTPPAPMTSYVAVVGPQTMWPGNRTLSLRDVPDGLTLTLQVVESHNSGIHWMEPRDFHVTQMAPTVGSKSGQGISSNHIRGAHVLLGDGSVRTLSDNLPAETIRALLTRDGGETIGYF